LTVRSLETPDARRATLIGAAVAVWGLLAAVHYQRLGLTLAHYDARAHLVVARRIFDSLYPGWQQVGGVWLPLPHLLNALPVQIDVLYRTGWSAVAISIASVAVAAWAIASTIHRATGSLAGAVTAAALLVVNPNILYLQSTPMTEPLLFGTTFLAVALVAKWISSDPPYSTTAAGWSLVAASLSRFEAWPVVAVLILSAFLVLVRTGVPAREAMRRVRGLALWPMWAVLAFLVNSKITVGSWFVASGFFVPDNPARGHIWMAGLEVWDGLVRLSGPALPWIALIAAVAIKLRFFWAQRAVPRTSERQLLLVLPLATCVFLVWAAYYQGHPVRIRYDVPLVAAVAAIVGTGVALLPRRIRPIAAIALVGAALWQTPPFDRQAPVIVEAQRVAADDAGRQVVSAYLSAHWDGQPIMMSMGSLAQYMHDLSAYGFRVRDFLHEGNGELWKYAMRTPHPYVEWIAIQEKADRDDIFRQIQVDPRFLSGYARVVSGGGVAVYRRIGAR
jgi:hypothetical protein